MLAAAWFTVGDHPPKQDLQMGVEQLHIVAMEDLGHKGPTLPQGCQRLCPVSKVDIHIIIESVPYMFSHSPLLCSLALLKNKNKKELMLHPSPPLLPSPTHHTPRS